MNETIIECPLFELKRIDNSFYEVKTHKDKYKTKHLLIAIQIYCLQIQSFIETLEKENPTSGLINIFNRELKRLSPILQYEYKKNIKK